MRLPTIKNIIAVENDGPKQVSTLRMESADGRNHFVPISFGAFNALVPMILNIAKSTDASGKPSKDVQPVSLTGARSAAIGDQPAMDLWFDGVPLTVSLSRKSIEGLRNVLDQAEKESAERKAGTRH